MSVMAMEDSLQKLRERCFKSYTMVPEEEKSPEMRREDDFLADESVKAMLQADKK